MGDLENIEEIKTFLLEMEKGSKESRRRYEDVGESSGQAIEAKRRERKKRLP